jgi:hypothetical protein
VSFLQAAGQDFIKAYGEVTLDWSNPITAGLVGYWPFTEGAGRRWRELVRQGNPTFSVYPGRWVQTPAGHAIDIIEADSTGQIIQTPNPVAGLATATLGVMIVPRLVRTASPFNGAMVFGSTGNSPKWKISADGTIDEHCRVDFISSTAYARPNTGQLTVDTLYTIFATWVSGSNPSVYKAQWPNGALTEFTYFGRGAASGTISATNIYLGLDTNFQGRMTLLWRGMWNRVLKTHEMQSLADSPWQLIAGEDDWLTAAAGGWASRIRQDRPAAARVVS